MTSHSEKINELIEELAISQALISLAAEVHKGRMERKRKAIKALEDFFDEMLENLYDCFNQACGNWNKKEESVSYNHGFLSAYENTQQFLIDIGRIRKEECEIRTWEE